MLRKQQKGCQPICAIFLAEPLENVTVVERGKLDPSATRSLTTTSSCHKMVRYGIQYRNCANVCIVGTQDQESKLGRAWTSDPQQTSQGCSSSQRVELGLFLQSHLIDRITYNCPF